MLRALAARVVWRILRGVLAVNCLMFGRGSSRELCRDLEGIYRA